MTELKKLIHDDFNGLDYALVGEYYFPVLTLDSLHVPTGLYGLMHERYLFNNRPIIYNELMLNGRLQSYLADINQQAYDRLNAVVEQIRQRDGITEELKMCDPLEWVRRMNNARHIAEETIFQELIFA